MKILRTFFFSIGRQILALLALLLILFLCFLAFNRRTLSFFIDTYEKQTVRLDSIQTLRNQFFDGNTYFADFLKTGNRASLAEFNQSANKSFDLISEIVEELHTDDGVYLLRSIETGFSFYFSQCCQASFSFSTKNYEDSFGYYGQFQYAQSVLNYLLKYCDELLEMVIAENKITYGKMTQKEQVLNVYNVVFVSLLILFYLSFLLYISKKLTSPLSQLVRFSNYVADGDFSHRIPEYKTANSVGVLIHAFNKMCTDLQRMMDSLKETVKTEEKLLREQRKNLEYKELLNQANFLALQSQTNPHFLFNTLNSISRTITLGKSEQSLEMIDCLSDLLRYSLSEAEIPVELESELNVSEEYIHIQQLRFGERIKYVEKVEESLRTEVRLPKFTLQPLIENAIIHGLEPKEGGGMVVLSAKRRGKYAVIRIFDNGNGIPKSVLEQIAGKKYESKKGRIGVLNTQKRLELHEKSSKKVFSIISREGKWTRISIRLKIKSVSKDRGKNVQTPVGR